MSMTHFAEVSEWKNKLRPWYPWTTTLCGMRYTESPISMYIEHVDCSKCLRNWRHYEKHQDNLVMGIETEPWLRGSIAHLR